MGKDDKKGGAQSEAQLLLEQGVFFYTSLSFILLATSIKVASKCICPTTNLAILTSF